MLLAVAPKPHDVCISASLVTTAARAEPTRKHCRGVTLAHPMHEEQTAAEGAARVSWGRGPNDCCWFTMLLAEELLLPDVLGEGSSYESHHSMSTSGSSAAPPPSASTSVSASANTLSNAFCASRAKRATFASLG